MPIIRANPALLIPVTAAFSTRQDDFAPTGYGVLSSYEYEIQCAITASAPISGLQGGRAGRKVTIVNSSTNFLLWLEHEAASSSAANRITLPDGFPAWLPPGDHITLIYRAGTSRWEVYSWPMRGMAMGLTYFDDFAGGETATAGVNTQYGVFTGGTSGTGAAIASNTTHVDSTEKGKGILQLSTGTTTTGSANIGGMRGSLGNTMLPGQGCAIAVGRLSRPTAPDGTETFQISVGMHDGYGNSINDGALWEIRYNGSAEEWCYSAVAGTVYTRATTGAPSPDNTQTWFAVFLNSDWTRADFIYSKDSKAFTLAGSASSGLPSGTQLVGASMMIQKSAGTTARTCFADFFGYRYDVGARG